MKKRKIKLKLKKKERAALAAAAVVFVALIYQLCVNPDFIGEINNDTPSAYTEELSDYYPVERVVDGDTLKVNIDGETITVRLIGVDTPESVHPDNSKNTEEGKIASDYVKNMLDGSSVKLEYDTDQYDRYDRTLAYVYMEDGIMLNALLIQEGYAKALTVEPNTKYEDYFAELQEEACANDKGFWSNGTFVNDQ